MGSSFKGRSHGSIPRPPRLLYLGHGDGEEAQILELVLGLENYVLQL